MRGNSTDAIDGSKTSPSLTSPSTPDGCIIGKGVNADKHDNSGDHPDSLRAECKTNDSSSEAGPQNTTATGVNNEANSPLMKNCEVQDEKESDS